MKKHYVSNGPCDVQELSVNGEDYVHLTSDEAMEKLDELQAKNDELENLATVRLKALQLRGARLGEIAVLIEQALSKAEGELKTLTLGDAIDRIEGLEAEIRRTESQMAIVHQQMQNDIDRLMKDKAQLQGKLDSIKTVITEFEASSLQGEKGGAAAYRAVSFIQQLFWEKPPGASSQ